MSVITRIFVQYPLPVQSPRSSIPIKSFMRCARHFRALPFESALIHFRSLQLRQQTYVQEGSYPMKRAGFLDSLGLTPRAAIVNPIWVRFRAHFCARTRACDNSLKVGRTPIAQTGKCARFLACGFPFRFDRVFPLILLFSCVEKLAHQPPPVAALLKELQKSGALGTDVVEQVLEIISLVRSAAIPPTTYSRLTRCVRFQTARISNFLEYSCAFVVRMLNLSMHHANHRNPLSGHERLLFAQLDGNLRLGQSGQYHQDLSGLQVELLL
jgi:hypothetical protein